MTRRALAATALLLAACGGYKKDLETICDGRARAKAPPGANAAAKDEALATYLMLNVHSPKAKKLYASLGSASLADKAKRLRGEAAKEGLTACALADELDP